MKKINHLISISILSSLFFSSVGLAVQPIPETLKRCITPSQIVQVESDQMIILSSENSNEVITASNDFAAVQLRSFEFGVTSACGIREKWITQICWEMSEFQPELAARFVCVIKSPFPGSGIEVITEP